MTKIIVSSPAVPRLFGFAKTHKPGKSIRPVVDKCSASTILLEKKLKEFIMINMPAHQYSITQAVEVIQKLKQLKLSEKSYMTVFDFKAMYPSVKLEPCFGHLRDFLLEKVENAAKVRRQILELVHLATFSSFFEFEDTTYKQHRGVPMGSPVSGLLCKLVVRSLESSKLHKYKGKILLYARYVDDVCIIWNEKPDVEKFSRDINNNIFGLELEIEQQSHRKIHFLDIDIKVEEEGKIATKVYRKPSYIPEMIP
ncbi:uncharacterized protein [Centruroides vittatus]|uniref:uncharacterized protein n=1 Tax=Centruroides vittatus TaxID=120091 RepID=UPI0035107932